MNKLAGFLLLLSFVLSNSSCVVQSTQKTASPAIANTIAPPKPNTSSPRPANPSPTTLPSRTTKPPASQTPTTTRPTGKRIIVDNPADSGVGTLREALENSRPGDTIEFDTTIFNPHKPRTVYVKSNLPIIVHDHLTIDASWAGIILKGSMNDQAMSIGLDIAGDGCSVHGLHLEDFDVGIRLSAGAQSNLIGGDPSIGESPSGQGNIILLSNTGVEITGDNSSKNIISGNQIGVGVPVRSNEGNQIGILIANGAMANQIGPENLIANNLEAGILMQGTKTTGNIVTGNRIFNNNGSGIQLKDGANHQVNAPIFISYDLESGFVSGVACVLCIVDIYSDQEGEGAVYEGSVQSDESGRFSLRKGVALNGPKLTATSSDEENGTSEFSQPTKSPSLIQFQVFNYKPLSKFITKDASELEDTHIGGWNHFDRTETTYNTDYAWEHANEFGLSWTRVTVEWPDWEEVQATGEYSTMELPLAKKMLVEALHKHDFDILFTLLYWDAEVKYYQGYSRFQDETEIQRFLDYVRLIATELNGKVEWYSLLNEPDSTFYGQRVKVEDYLALARRVRQVLAEVDPQAQLVLGEVSSINNKRSYDYLKAILQSDMMPNVGGVVWHVGQAYTPVHFPDFYQAYPGMIDEIKQIAVSHGFQGKYFITELNYRSPDMQVKSVIPFPEKSLLYSPKIAQKYWARAILLHQSKDVEFGCGCGANLKKRPYIISVLRNMANLHAGAESHEMEITVQTQASNLIITTFSVSNGEMLLALYNDVVAVEEDSGVLASIAMPVTGIVRAIAVDPLKNYQQELVIESSGEGLVIKDLIVRDYPIVIRLQRGGLQ
ncbi:MAG: right-handed parallel beta-helix repeat-containing protein [Anaerolineales bacterium]|nr:right-handed parallel beta-helix repeat-containing protein [Anaerolineales bacterium]